MLRRSACEALPNARAVARAHGLARSRVPPRTGVLQVRHVHNARAAPDVETRMFVLLSAGYVDLLKTFPGMHDIVMENAIHQHEGAR